MQWSMQWSMHSFLARAALQCNVPRALCTRHMSGPMPLVRKGSVNTL